MAEEKITFRFGENWNHYLQNLTEDDILGAQQDIDFWLGKDNIKGKKVIDIGSGSGVHSLSFYLSEASEIFSFDYDKGSVEATKKLWEKEGKPDNWTISEGSILDSNFIEDLGKFDIIYCWGVLPFTGKQWDALDNACKLVAAKGKIWISLYTAGDKFERHYKMKVRYNNGSNFKKKYMRSKFIFKYMAKKLLKFENPMNWNEPVGRGMNKYNDLVDWLGGLPYEVAEPDDVIKFCSERDLVLDRIKVKGQGACSIYVFQGI